ncbi:MAG: hypothetical protein KBF66_13065 [Rhodoferax sp.]|uniref:hypothetical protein n=1 Tax=Rhodoferax sp. TaxID=50421 RepID=UPI001B607B8F|nr:hypothetical protein [Rhodoferax sp.]MBP9906489.1 hypothetical protein [Rhodoferax sp.]
MSDPSTPRHTHPHQAGTQPRSPRWAWLQVGALGWSARWRVALVSPLLLLLWLAVWWASQEVAPW